MTPFFVFDVESVGLHGEGFAVSGGVYIGGACQYGFCFACPLEEAAGSESDRKWVKANVPLIEVTHSTPEGVREAFWGQWLKAKDAHPGICMAGECIWPVEAGFVSRCIAQDPEVRNWAGPYPFHDIASIMLTAGMDPLAEYDRLPGELPKHHPSADAAQSARLLFTALQKITRR